MSVRWRRGLTCVAAICWSGAAAVIAGRLAGRHWADSYVFGGDVAIAGVLTVGIWLDHLVTPLIAGHVLGYRAGARAGLREAARGRHVKAADHGRVVVPIRRQHHHH